MKLKILVASLWFQQHLLLFNLTMRMKHATLSMKPKLKTDVQMTMHLMVLELVRLQVGIKEHPNLQRIVWWGQNQKSMPRLAKDPNFANRNYYCDGNRTCSGAGFCQGKYRWLWNIYLAIQFCLTIYSIFDD